MYRNGLNSAKAELIIGAFKKYIYIDMDTAFSYIYCPPWQRFPFIEINLFMCRARQTLCLHTCICNTDKSWKTGIGSDWLQHVCYQKDLMQWANFHKALCEISHVRPAQNTSSNILLSELALRDFGASQGNQQHLSHVEDVLGAVAYSLRTWCYYINACRVAYTNTRHSFPRH